MTGDFPCSVCQRVFDTPQGRGIHESRVHEEDTHCQTCGNLIPMEVDKLTYCSSSCRDLYHEDIEREFDSCRADGCNKKLTGFNKKFCSRSCSASENIDGNRHDGLSGEDNPVFRSDIDNDEVKRLYTEEGMSTEQIAAYLQADKMTIWNRLQKMNVEMQDAVFGVKQTTSFGLEVKSNNEAITAEWLDRFGPENWEYEPSFPGRYTPDFVLGDGTVMEVWGMDTDKYMTQKKKKQQWYSNEGYELINVESQDINDMKQMMEVA